MSGFVVLGTDTDAGKTSFSLLFLTAFSSDFAYWKPVETGASDSEKVRSLVPSAHVFDTLARFQEPVAPLLASRREGRPMPSVAMVAAAIPASTKPLLIETFGGPFSPFDESSLQLDLVKRLNLPAVLVGSSSVGAVGRGVGMLHALEIGGITPAAFVLLGSRDEFAEEQLARHGAGIPVVSLTMPEVTWTAETLLVAVSQQHENLVTLKGRLESRPVDSLRDLPARDARVIWHPYTPLQGADAPLPVVAAEAEFLILADGRRLIDGISSWWTVLHGHAQPEILRAIAQAAGRLDHVQFAGLTHPHAVEVAERLLSFMPWSVGGRVFYSDNGSTAVEVALKMAYQFWCHRGESGRRLFVGFEHGYHGDTFGAMAISRDPVFFGRFEPLLFESRLVPVDANALDEMLTRNAGCVSAVIIEPLVQGAGGMLMHGPETLRDLFDVSRRHGVLFIADEVMTGFGRTGSRFAFEQAGIAPDLVCVAKGLTGGVLPMSATLASPAIVAEFETPDRTRTFFHGHSFTASPIACAAASASLNLLADGSWKAQVDRIRQHFTSQLQPLANRPGVKDVRFRGLIAAIELDAPGGYLSDRGAALRRTCLEHGVMLRPLGNVLYSMPPLCTSNESLERITEAMTMAVMRHT